jgi:hypothetical protein
MARPTARWRSSSPSGRRTEGRPVREERRAAPPAAPSRSRAVVGQPTLPRSRPDAPCMPAVLHAPWVPAGRDDPKRQRADGRTGGRVAITSIGIRDWAHAVSRYALVSWRSSPPG